MDLRRLRKGEWIAAISGVVLLISLFLPWWSLPAYFERSADLAELNAWEVLSVADILFALLGVLGIAVGVIAARASAAGPGVAAEALAAPFALVMAIVGLTRVVGTPGALELPGLEPSTEYGAWIGLAAIFGVLVGVLVGMRDERLSTPDQTTDATGVPAAPPEIETLPGPPAA